MQLCTVPPWNNIWGAMGIGAFYDRKFDDQDVCYKVCPRTCNNFCYVSADSHWLIDLQERVVLFLAPNFQY